MRWLMSMDMRLSHHHRTCAAIYLNYGVEWRDRGICANTRARTHACNAPSTNADRNTAQMINK